MGDCRIRLLVASSLLPKGEGNSNSDDDVSMCNIITDANAQKEDNKQWTIVLNKAFSSDTTVREVIDEAKVVLPLLLQSNKTSCRLWDCTVHPPQDITAWPLTTYPDIKGLKSRTLFDAGWFPSGALRVSLESDGIPTASLQYDDAQYNLPTSSLDFDGTTTAAATMGQEGGSAAVRLVGTTDMEDSDSPLKPSQVLHSVTKRFHDEDAATNISQAEALRQRRLNLQEQKQKEQKRFQKLDARIRRLNETSKTNKNKAVSDQVKRMLIKSRATGATSLKPQDRVYFQMAILVDDDGGDEEEEESTEEFRYFSIQDTVSRILSQFTCSTSNKKKSDKMQAELLIKRTGATNSDLSHSSNTSKNNNAEKVVCYRRLPNMMRVYEAIEQKYFEPEFNNVVIRWYDPSTDDATISAVEDKELEGDSSVIVKEGTEEMEVDTDLPSLSNSQKNENNVATVTVGVQESSSPQNHLQSIIVDKELANRIRKMDVEEQKKSKKKASAKTSAALTKVRQMQIKSKAKGDAKRLSKIEDRFFFELITVDKQICEASFVYLGKQDPLHRILRDCVKSSLAKTRKEEGFELLVPVIGSDENDCDEAMSSQFQRLVDLSTTFQEAETAKQMQPFRRLVIRFHSA